MSQKNHDFYVEVVDKNFQANIEQDLGILIDKGQRKPVRQNQFLQNTDQQDYNNKPATPFQKKKHQLNDDDEEQQQMSDQQPTYTFEKVLPKHNQKQRLIQQNIKLKAQIYELAKQLDQIIDKDRSKKKKFGLNIIQEEDQLIRDKKLQLKKQQLQIMELKNKIFVAKRQLESVYNNFVATERQNLIKKLQGHLKQLQKQKEGVLNINNEQNKVLKVAQNEEQYGLKVQITKKQYIRVKTQTRKLVLKTQQKQKTLKKYHQIYIDKLQNLKQIESKLALNRQKSRQVKKSSQSVQAISEDMIKQFQSQVKQLQIKRKEGQKEWQQKIKNIDIQLYKKRIQQERKMLVLRQKQKQLRLNELRIKQLRKMIRDNDIAQKQKRNQQVDMSQFRHKRNIRYIQK